MWVVMAVLPLVDDIVARRCIWNPKLYQQKQQKQQQQQQAGTASRSCQSLYTHRYRIADQRDW